MPAIKNGYARTLTESEKATLSNGLRVAAERFGEHVRSLSMKRCQNCHDRPGKDGLGRTCKTCGGSGDVPETKPGLVSLAAQFMRQIGESITMADLIDNSEQITLEIPEPDPNWCYSCDRPKDDCACEKEQPHDR